MAFVVVPYVACFIMSKNDAILRYLRLPRPFRRQVFRHANQLTGVFVSLRRERTESLRLNRGTDEGIVHL